MTTIMNIDEPRPRGTVMGRQLSGPFTKRRDLVWCEEHQQPLPHPAGDRVQ
jgi:hypothetical protein